NYANVTVNQILLNGQPAGNGYGTQLAVADGGNVYAFASVWWEWDGSGGWYSVSAPSGLTPSGSTSNTPQTSPSASTSSLATTPAFLSVLKNAAASPINIPGPTDANYASSQLSVKVTAMPTDGTVLLSDGVTAVIAGESL